MEIIIIRSFKCCLWWKTFPRDKFVLYNFSGLELRKFKKKLLDFYNILRLLLIHRTGFLDVDWPW